MDLEDKIKNLKALLEEKILKLQWDFVEMKSNYEKELSEKLWFTDEQSRYWDADYKWIKIEYKKWKSIWLDLVRYSEILLKINKEASHETFTLFFIPDKEKKYIKEIIWINTIKLIKKLNLIENIAISLIELNNKLPRSFNAQASLTLKDIRSIADFILTNIK